MAEQKKTEPTSRVSQSERLHYIGFEVFPGEAKDLFASEAEKKKYLAEVRRKHETGDLLRENCTLTEERVSGFERIVLFFACLAVVASLFVPWYAVYDEKIETIAIPAPQDTLIASAATDSEVNPADTVPAKATTDSLTPSVPAPQAAPVEEIITATQTKKRVNREHASLSGIGSLIDIGNSGATLMGSGLTLLITCVILLAYTLACVAVPGYVFYKLLNTKGDPDVVALKLKSVLRVAWWPLLGLCAALLLSFFGGSYPVSAVEAFSSIGTSYGPIAFLGTLTWGIYLSVVGFLLLGLKSIEI